ncbi:unnamed protein product [Chrysodeixis includens]|uniref:Uncharacterized protein n=1 Tax=Chrysodeixis includens TaxID=689277 RepID=A0A9N8KZ21_CHRIL|nr:unnamed protein product [Chrysodeixis includens]
MPIVPAMKFKMIEMGLPQEDIEILDIARVHISTINGNIGLNTLIHINCFSADGGVIRRRILGASYISVDDSRNIWRLVIIFSLNYRPIPWNLISLNGFLVLHEKLKIRFHCMPLT